MTSSNDEFGISDHDIVIYTWVVYGVAVQVLNVFGIVTNTINIFCFVRQGFQDTINISLLGLAVSDLGSLTTMVWTCISLTPAVMTADLPFDPVEVMYVTTAVAHFSFTRVSSCITAMITLERCLCITLPLKIKSLITPQRATLITVSVFIIFFITSTPMYVVNKLDMKFSPHRNKTLIGLVSRSDRKNVEMLSLSINNFFIPMAAFAVIVVCTIILSTKLRKASKWRKNTITSNSVDRVSSRNQKASRLVMMISVLFIVCFIPVSIIMFAMAFTPALSIHGRYMNITIIIAGLGYILEGLNSSMNIFIYYHMSSVYRVNFRNLLLQSGNTTKLAGIQKGSYTVRNSA